MKLYGWGRYPSVDAQVHAPRAVSAVIDIVLSSSSTIARGNGRAYGDSAINPVATIETRYLQKMIAFDQSSGQLIDEAGVLLGDVISVFVRREWFPLVTS